MKISKRKFKRLVEEYLFEQDDSGMTSTDNPELALAQGQASLDEKDLQEWIDANNITEFNGSSLYELLSDPQAYLLFSTPSTIDVGVSSLKFMTQYGKVVGAYDAVSGNKDFFGNDPLEMMATKAYPDRGIAGGPTPEGTYKLDDLQKLGWKAKWRQKVNHALVNLKLRGRGALAMADMDTPEREAAWGNVRYSLIPSMGNEMFGRNQMYIHGGKFPGSAGCIDLTDKMEEFAKVYEFWKVYTGEDTIKLIVDYPPIGEFTDYDLPSDKQFYTGQDATKDTN